MKKNERNLLVLIGLVMLLLYIKKPLGTICSYDFPIMTNFITQQLDFTCGANLGCKYTTSCSLDRIPHPSSSGEIDFEETVSFYCHDSDSTEPSGYITLTITGSSCTQQAPIVTPRIPPEGFTTDENVVVEVRVDGVGQGYIVHGRIKELYLERQGYTSFGIARLDFGNLQRGSYTLEIWGENADLQTIPFTVYGVLDVTYSFEPIQPYNFIEGYIYLKDENDRGLSEFDVNYFDAKIRPYNGWNYFTIVCSYFGKDEVLGGKWHCTGNTQDYIGDAVVDVTVKKAGYLDALQHINVKTFIPSLVIEAYCQDLNCPFPRMVTLGDTETFTFYVKHKGTLVDADIYSVSVTNPSRTVVNKDITSSVTRTSTGTYTFSYGSFTEIEDWTFTLYASYLGADPQTIYPKVTVTKEEPPILFNPWLIIVPLAIIGIVLWLRRKK